MFESLLILCPASPLLAFLACWWIRGNRYFFAKWRFLAVYYGLIGFGVLAATLNFVIMASPVNALVVGFSTCGAFFAVMSGPMVALLLLVSEYPSRYPPGHCQTCGYNLTGNVSGICPECGTRISKGIP